MRFIDEVMIEVHAGNGGDGCVAFRREAHVPRGGPSGGDGGRGGSVMLVADEGLTTLLDLKYQRLYRAKRGGHGEGSDCYGKGSPDLRVRVPCGTLAYDKETGALLADLVAHGDEFVAARGGRGGRGNRHFATSTNRAPRDAEPGEPGEQRVLRIELRLIADVGLVGLPNAGKSTLIAAVSAARPRIADYPFTTLTPNLGVVSVSPGRSFVMADIPGLIEGARTGAGLGHQFLRHIQRTRVLVFLVDDRHALIGEPGSPIEDLEVLQRELSAFDPELTRRPMVIALSKVDLLDPARLQAILDEFAGRGVRVLPLSAATRTGISPLLDEVWRVFHAADDGPAQ